MPLLVVITGPPGAGKTALARRLACDLCLPLLSKDDIKEGLFDILGCSDRAWAQRLGHASMEVLFRLLAVQLAAGASGITETAFIPHYHTPRFLELGERYSFMPFQVYCTAEPGVLFARFCQRYASGERHSGHADAGMTREQFHELMVSGRYGPLEIGGTVLHLDTTDWGQVDYGALLSSVRGAR